MAAQPRDDLDVRDVEVVTVTDTSAVVTWYTAGPDGAPADADTELLLGDVDFATGGPAAGTLRTVLHDETPTPYHHAEVDGLEPGRPYAYVARSGGVDARQTSLQFPVGPGGSFDLPGMFVTLATPPGRYLFTLALCNDLHVGELVSGVAFNGWPPGFRQDPGLPPYPEVMLTAVLDETRDADLLLVAGDVTGDGLPAEAAHARRLLDTRGELGRDYLVVRGNHDRPRVGAPYRDGTPVAHAPDHHDCFGDAFGLRPQQLTVREFAGLRVVGLDTTTLDTAGGTMSAEQLAELDGLLRDEPERPTLVFGHHPVTYEAAITTAAGPSFDLDVPSALALQRSYERAPGVFLHHSGHTHRNKRTYFDDGSRTPRTDVECLEVGAVKEYAGGYTLLRVHTGGYLASFHKTRSALARAWSQRTRGQYLGLYPNYMLGTIADRNHTVVRDLSGLTPPPAADMGS